MDFKQPYRIIILALLGGIFMFPSSSVWGQYAKKPSIVVVPSTEWCVRNGFSQDIDGYAECDILKSFANSQDLGLVANKIAGYMADRGFPTKNVAQQSRGNSKRDAIRSARRSKSSFSKLRDNSVDQILRNTEPDIAIQVSWEFEKSGPNRKLTIEMTAVDAYTYEIVAQTSATGAGSYSASTNELLQEAVIGNFDNFCARLDDHFKDMLENGRKIAFAVGVWESAPYDLEKEFNGKELRRIIKEWMDKNSVKGRYSLNASSENFMEFDPIRIDPTIDSEEFGYRLQDFLKTAPYNLESKVSMMGLGYTEVIIGEK